MISMSVSEFRTVYEDGCGAVHGMLCPFSLLLQEGKGHPLIHLQNVSW